MESNEHIELTNMQPIKLSKPALMKILMYLPSGFVNKLAIIGKSWDTVINSDLYWKSRYDRTFHEDDVTTPEFLDIQKGPLAEKYRSVIEILHSIDKLYPNRSWKDLYHIAQHLTTDLLKMLVTDLSLLRDNWYEAKIQCLLHMDPFVCGHDTNDCKRPPDAIHRPQLNYADPQPLFVNSDGQIFSTLEKTPYKDLVLRGYLNGYDGHQSYCAGILEASLFLFSNLYPGEAYVNNVFKYMTEILNIDLDTTNVFWNNETPLTCLFGTFPKGTLNLVQATVTLIEFGADPNKMDGNGLTPLICCIDLQGKHTQARDVLDRLLQRGANPNLPDALGRYPLLIAHADTNSNLFDCLIARNDIDVNVVDSEGNCLAKLTRKICRDKIMQSVGTLERHRFLTQFVVGLMFFLLVYVIFRNI